MLLITPTPTPTPEQYHCISTESLGTGASRADEACDGCRINCNTNRIRIRNRYEAHGRRNIKRSSSEDSIINTSGLAHARSPVFTRFIWNIIRTSSEKRRKLHHAIIADSVDNTLQERLSMKNTYCPAEVSHAWIVFAIFRCVERCIYQKTINIVLFK